MANTLKKENLALVVRALYENPDGLWIRELSRKTGLAVSTVHNYINMISPLIDESVLGGEKRPMIRVVRLKPEVIERIDSGLTVDELLTAIEILRKI